MSGRRSSATDAAVAAYRNRLRPWKSTRSKRLRLAADIAKTHGIHKTTLYRALGFYKKGKSNGHG